MAALYGFAIVFRVACYFSSVKIPTLGRAFLGVGLTHGTTYLFSLCIQGNLVPSYGFHAALQFTVFVLILLFHCGLSVIVYAKLLRTRWSQSFTVWLLQTLISLGLIVLFLVIFAVIQAIAN